MGRVRARLRAWGQVIGDVCSPSSSKNRPKNKPRLQNARFFIKLMEKVDGSRLLNCRVRTYSTEFGGVKAVG